MEIFINNKPQFVINNKTSAELRYFLEESLGLKPEEYYLLSNGRLVDEFNVIESSKVHIVPRVFGGKGGFGSMLRAIGAQIEKTTNREACRDLSGRRLRDINEEQRLKNWINQQAEREKEAKVRKQKKLERLCEMPKHEFKDEQYDKERSDLPEMVEDALLRGLEASSSTKRKAADKEPIVKKKKKLWVDDDLDDLSSSEGEDDESSSEESKKSPGTKNISNTDNSSNSESTNASKNTVGDAVTTQDDNEEESNAKVVENLENNGSENTEGHESENNETNEEKTEENESIDTEKNKNVEK